MDITASTMRTKIDLQSVCLQVKIEVYHIEWILFGNEVATQISKK